jgi:class 3 adenylate cyclase/tetratricopeptide (TPR) repeat protein
MDIGGWLRSLGLEKFEAAFRENEINERVLPSLTAEDLKELGVTALGHRRILQDAIAALSNDTRVQTRAVAAAPTRPPVPTPTAAPLAEAVGERRHVTVMFCDLVGSTGISAGLDAEDWRDLLGAYLDAASAAVTEMGGHVAKKLGDGLMALFGYPTAHENDAERAARAALSIQLALGEVNRKNVGSGKPPLNVRVGIETGPVVVDAVGEIYGDAPNVAARVQALADPGMVLMTAQVQRQIVGLFVAEERGSHKIKGVPEPVTLFRLARASGGGRRVGQRRLTPLVGREEEVAMLMRRWERAQQGDGQLVLIVGEPGIGKSRLIEEFHERLRDTPHTWVEWNCSQLLQSTALHPISEWGRQRFGVYDVPAEQRLADLENSLAQLKLEPAENVSLLAPLLDIPLPKERISAMPPDESRRRQLAALTNWVMAGARSQCVVLAVEDLQWADPTTLELLRGIAERGALAPLLVLMTARPEFRPPWGARSHHGTISLVPLDRHQVRYMVEGLAARHALAKELIEGVTERTAGVPLFIEEVTRLLLERGEQAGIQAIPPTLQQSLTARLDRLGPAREVAQIGAVIGRGFSYPLIRAVARMDDGTLQTALEGLAEADILLVEGLPPESEYRFKHALIQDAAYENLLKSRRQVLHRRVAEVLLDKLATAVEAEPELLAHHFTQAGLIESAIKWWDRAGQRSLECSALVEAAEQLTRALDQIETLPATPALRRDHIKLQVALITPLIHVKGYAAPETKAAAEQAQLLIEKAEMLGEPPDDPLLLFSVLYGFWSTSNRVDTLCAVAAQFLTLAEKQGTSAALTVANRLMGTSVLLAGDVAASRAHYDQAIALYDPAEHRPLATQFGQDHKVSILTFRALSLWLLGYPEAALRDVDNVLKHAREINHAASLMFTLTIAAVTPILCGNYAAAKTQLDEVAALADEKGALSWKLWGATHRIWLLALTGGASDAVHAFPKVIADYQSMGATTFLPFYLSCLTSVYAELKQFDDAWRCIGEAMTTLETTKQRWCEAEIFRIAGETMIKSCCAAKAEPYLTRALAVSREQQAKSWELRSAMSMARLWRSQGKVQQARELLAPVYGWFTEGFDTLDLKEAKALLEQLKP